MQGRGQEQREFGVLGVYNWGMPELRDSQAVSLQVNTHLEHL